MDIANLLNKFPKLGDLGDLIRDVFLRGIYLGKVKVLPRKGKGLKVKHSDIVR
jgi:hypothetical protein